MMNDIISEYKGTIKDLAPNTMQAYVKDVGHFLDYLNRIGISYSKASPKIIRRYLNSTGGKAKISNRRLSSITSFCRFLVEQELIEVNPASGMKRYKVEETVPKFLKQQDISIIRQACKQSLVETHPPILVETIISIFSFTGVRLEELRTCELNSLDLQKRELKVMGKGRIERYVPFPMEIIPLLNSYLEWRNQRPDITEYVGYLFISSTGIILSRNQIGYITKKLSKVTGIFVRPHKLRHSFATSAIERGMSRESLSAILGHKRISTTDWYVHIKPKVKEEYDKAFGH